ncbi:MAG: CDP-diacylglycerol--serine O-phosphatidyltransferase [Ignavibacteria bacterium]|nr:CDP-diacylglycerol--serine O-phosphatidyltransferase [Ignavibacteria bacterium]
MNAEYSHRIRRILPNTLTFGNMLCGFYSVILSYQHEFITAAWLIAIAAVCDALDGIAARLTKSPSQFGIELDSLADVVSFGFAPAFLIYLVQLKDYGIWGLIISGLFLMAGGFRLARFNAELVGYSKEQFKGLPIPTGALTIASYVIMFLHGDYLSITMQWYTMVLVIGVAYLMASHVKYDALPNPNRESIKKKPLVSLFILVAAVLFLLYQGAVLFYLFLIFIMYGIVNQILGFIKK